MEENLKILTGIGLYICKKIADNLGHEISVESEVGEGTSVKITYISKEIL
ncbi:ATP-binding protein [Clostridium sp. DMHC 10]|nr:ATP-binding protein [Clostridium sp. DMHC 10]